MKKVIKRLSYNGLENIYTFKNLITEREFTGDKFEFAKYLDVDQKVVNDLIRGRFRHKFHWILIDIKFGMETHEIVFDAEKYKICFSNLNF